MTRHRQSTATQLGIEADRERGPYLEQGRFLLGQIDAADSRRIALADQEWVAAVQRMRNTIAEQGRVRAEDLITVRCWWPAVQAMALPPLAAAAPAQRSFTEPADA